MALPTKPTIEPLIPFPALPWTPLPAPSCFQHPVVWVKPGQLRKRSFTFSSLLCSPVGIWAPFLFFQLKDFSLISTIYDLRGRAGDFLLSGQERIMLKISLRPSWWQKLACLSRATGVGRNGRGYGLPGREYLIPNGNVPPFSFLRVQGWQGCRCSESF